MRRHVFAVFVIAIHSVAVGLLMGGHLWAFFLTLPGAFLVGWGAGAFSREVWPR